MTVRVARCLPGAEAPPPADEAIPESQLVNDMDAPLLSAEEGGDAAWRWHGWRDPAERREEATWTRLTRDGREAKVQEPPAGSPWD